MVILSGFSLQLTLNYFSMCFNRHIPATFGPSQMDREMRIVYEIDELELDYRVVHLVKDRLLLTLK